MERECKVHGKHDNWRFKRYWICRFCHFETRRTKQITTNYQKLLVEFGQEVADEYKLATVDKGTHVNKFRGIGRRKSFGDVHTGLTRKIIGRIILLNTASNKPTNSLGWECAVCGTESREPAFFDIDRIVPGKDGGEYVAGNMQILCPNCHKCKTHSLPSWTANK